MFVWFCFVFNFLEMFDADHFWELNSTAKGCFKSQECSCGYIVAIEYLAVKT